MANVVPKTPPAAWIAMARQTLVEEGIQGVKVDRLAQRLGVTKGGFYKHFANRADLLKRLLRQWATDNEFVLSDAIPSDSADALAVLVSLTDRLIEEKGYDPHFDMAVRDWARTDPLADRALKRVDQRRVRQLRLLFAALGCDEQESEVRARVFYYHQIGYYAIGVEERKADRKRLLPSYLRILIGSDRLAKL